MRLTDPCPLANILADALRLEREQLVRRWLARISARVSIDPNRVFPTNELLDHIPLLIEGVAAYMEDPADEITADIPVIAKAMELGTLRHAQGFSAHQILKEYEVLGGVLFNFLTDSVDSIEQPCSRGELLACAHRLFRAVAVIQQVTTDQYLRLADARTLDRERRLLSFNRAVSHELKNRLQSAAGAVDLMREDWIAADPVQVQRFASVASRNLAEMRGTLQNLIELSRMDVEVGAERNVFLPEAVAEVKRQLREFSDSRGVRVDVSAELPRVEVPAAAMELALSNYISNAIKYRDRGEADPWVSVEAEVVDRAAGDCELVVRVRDNGQGVPESVRDQLFGRFFRVDETVTGEEGTGLGLAIVRETMTAVGGRAWVEFPEKGAVFALAVPCAPDPRPLEPEPGLERRLFSM